jgi:hypothetical protein
MNGRIKDANALIEPLKGYTVSVKDVLEEYVSYGDLLSVKGTDYLVTVDLHHHRRLQVAFYDDFGELLPSVHTIKVCMAEHVHTGSVIGGLELLPGGRTPAEVRDEDERAWDDREGISLTEQNNESYLVTWRKEQYKKGMPVSYVHIDEDDHFSIREGILESFDGNLALISGEEYPVAAGFLAVSPEGAVRILRTLKNYPSIGKFRKTGLAG